jgi:release factor glutamine methyltransferase
MGRNESQLQTCPPALRPTEYTAALLRQLQLNRSAVEGARVLEIGCGSGVLLAALARFGARSVCGVDIERDAVFQATSLLRDIERLGERARTGGCPLRPVVTPS